jgi:hypothetical protein
MLNLVQLESRWLNASPVETLSAVSGYHGVARRLMDDGNIEGYPV